MLPQSELNIPLIGDWTTIYKGRNMQQLPTSKKEDIPSSSSSSSKKIISYKEITVNDPPQEQVTDYFENPVTEKIMYIDDEDIQINPSDG